MLYNVIITVLLLLLIMTINCVKGQLCLTRLSRLFSNRKVAGSPALPAARRSALEQDTEPQSAPDEKWAPGQEPLQRMNVCVNG